MRKMGIAALGPRPNTTMPAPSHKIYPNLSRNLTIDRQPGVGGRHHVSADRPRLSSSRRHYRLGQPWVLAWRLSKTIDVSFYVAALEEALAKYGTLESFNTGPGRIQTVRRNAPEVGGCDESCKSTFGAVRTSARHYDHLAGRERRDASNRMDFGRRLPQGRAAKMLRLRPDYRNLSAADCSERQAACHQ